MILPDTFFVGTTLSLVLDFTKTEKKLRSIFQKIIIATTTRISIDDTWNPHIGEITYMNGSAPAILARVCHTCGHESFPGESSCPKCGHPLGSRTLSNSLLRVITLLTFLGVLAFFACAAYLLYTGGI